MSSSPLMATAPNLTSTPKILQLEKHLSLVLENDDLYIKVEGLTKVDARSCICCGMGSASQKTTTIELQKILWADVGEASITITFATPTSKSALKPTSLTYPYDLCERTAVTDWTKCLLQAAYGDSQLRKRLKVLINPFGGPGTAKQLFETSSKNMFEAAHCTLDIQETEYSGHAIEIAQKLDIEAYDAIVCCSGDGVPHEVFNGLGKRPDAMKALRSIAVCQLPAGSGNAMCWNLTGSGDGSSATVAIIKGMRKPIDLISITQGDSRFLSFLSQSFGIIADTDLGTENLRWMGGARFTYGLLQRVWKQTVYPCDLAVKVAMDDKELIREHYRQGGRNPENFKPAISDHMSLPELRFGTVNSPLPQDWELVHQPNMGNFYAGNMAWMSADANFFPASLPNDGLFDLVCIDGTIGRIKAMNMLLSVVNGKHFDSPHVIYKKVEGYRIIPHKRNGTTEDYISIDGERILFAPFQAEVHSGLGTVLAKGELYQATGV